MSLDRNAGAVQRTTRSCPRQDKSEGAIYQQRCKDSCKHSAQPCAWHSYKNSNVKILQYAYLLTTLIIRQAKIQLSPTYFCSENVLQNSYMELYYSKLPRSGWSCFRALANERKDAKLPNTAACTFLEGEGMYHWCKFMTFYGTCLIVIQVYSELP